MALDLAGVEVSMAPRVLPAPWNPARTRCDGAARPPRRAVSIAGASGGVQLQRKI